MKKCLLRSLVPINLECHRFPNESKSINKKALRMDGELGIRKQLGLENYNCCDYLSAKKDNLYLIEISDFIIQRHNLQKNNPIEKIDQIIRQEKNQNDSIKEIKKIISQEKNKNPIIKELKKIIRQEIRLKIMGSLIILFKIPTQFSISYEKIPAGKIRVILVLCEDTPTQCHRRLVAEYLRKKWKNVEIIHLF
jgi:hypothetical protein